MPPEHVSGTCVEGTLAEWLEIADAMKKRESKSFKRCSARWKPLVGTKGCYHFCCYHFCSPRNSMGDVEATLYDADVDAFADSILAQIGSGAGI